MRKKHINPNCQCASCKSKRGEYSKENHPNYRGKNFFKNKKCVDCGKLIHHHAIRCEKCYYKIESISRKGDRNQNWQGGISLHPYSYEFSEELKSIIRKRDKYICQLCNKKEKLEFEEIKRRLCIHHIDYNKTNCNLDNLICLCDRCNSKINFNRDYWQQYFHKKINYGKKINLTK